MEQTETLTLGKKNSWLTQKCRNLIFSSLGSLKDCCLIIHEGKTLHRFGDSDAELAAHMLVHDNSIYLDIVKAGSIGAAEGYLQVKWSTPNLTKLIQVFARNQQQLDQIESQTSWRIKLKNWLLSYQNANTQAGSKKNILAHYDLGNDLYTRFLDATMMYSCAIYPSKESDLNAAQLNKLKTICDKLALTETDHLVEIGTGWGGLAIYAAQNYGCKVTTTTISDAQYQYAAERIKTLKLDDKITLLKQDYRTVTGAYDKLVSIEMIEAVGHEFLPTFFAKCSSLLKPNGKMLIQAITIIDQRYDEYRKGIDFIQKYIFPGGCLPSIAEISKQIAHKTDMVIDHIHDIGLHYARTLADWRTAFDENWNEIQKFGYGEDFKRLWHYYLAYCEGAFIERAISTHHITARKPLYKTPEEAAFLSY